MRYKTLNLNLEQSIQLNATAPIIYALILPLALLDLFVSVYVYTCFPVYKIAIPDRKKYIAIDRHKLSYLNGIDRLNCMYCGYGNGLILWVQRIAAESEAFWCGIKHADREGFIHPDHHEDFLPYNQPDALEEHVKLTDTN